MGQTRGPRPWCGDAIWVVVWVVVWWRGDAYLYYYIIGESIYIKIEIERMWCVVFGCDVVWCGVAWCGDVVWCGVAWCGDVVMWCGVVWCVVSWWDVSCCVVV